MLQAELNEHSQLASYSKLQVQTFHADVRN